MKPLQWKEFFRCVLRTKSRFISMLLIASLGVAFYVGIRASGPDMELSADALYDQTNLMDIRVLGTLGMTEDDVDAIRAIEGITEAQGAYTADAILTISDREYIATLFSLCDSLNQMTVHQGRLPENSSECFVDSLLLQSTGLKIGDTITLSSGTEDPIEDTLSQNSFTIVGSGFYSWYLSWERGSTGIGNGNIDFFIGLMPDAFSMEAYTVVYAAVDSADPLNSYSDEYEAAITAVTDRIEAIADERCLIRYNTVTSDAQLEISDAQKEIDDAQKEIDDARLELMDGEKKLAEADLEIADAEKELLDAEKELIDGEAELLEGIRKLGDGRKELIKGEAEFKEQTAVFNTKKKELEDGENELNRQARMLAEKQAEVTAQKTALEQQKSDLLKQKEDLNKQLAYLTAQRDSLLVTKNELSSQHAQLNPVVSELRSQKQTLTAQKESILQGIALYDQRDSLIAQRTSLSSQLSQVESGLNTLAAERAPYDEQFAVLSSQRDSLNTELVSLESQQAELNGQLDHLNTEKASVVSAQSAVSALSPASWTTVSGYHAMLSRLSGLGSSPADLAERNILESVRNEVNNALSEDTKLTDSLLASVVPSAASSAISAQQSSLSAQESSLNAALSELSAKQSLLISSIESLRAALSSVNEAYTPLSQAIAAFDAKHMELTAGRDALTAGIAEIDSGLYQLNTAISSIGMSREELTPALTAIESGLSQINANLPALESTLSQLNAGIAEVNSGLSQLESGITQITAGLSVIAGYEQQITDGLAQIADGQKQLTDAHRQISEAQETLEEGRRQLEEGAVELEKARRLLIDKRLELREGEAEVNEARRLLADGKIQLRDGRKELTEGKAELTDKRAEYDQGLLDYQEALAEAEPELNDARLKLSDAREQLSELETPEWYILDRNSIQTFVEYGLDAERIRAIGTVFPVIFFLVAALVCLTGMTRMVEEERIQIGTLKALGYGKYMIAAKYFLYAFIASLIGSIIGILLGSRLLPVVIMGAYGILYSTLTLVLTPIHWGLSMSAVALSVFCTVFAAMAACLRTLRETPANLMRPSAPPKGKRVFLEYITPLWGALSFAQKAAARNLFRYKKRLIMTIIGIAGCMALLVVGFGLQDSINKIVATQYTQVWTYDAGVSTDKENIGFLRETLTLKEPVITDQLAVHQTSMEVESPSRSIDAYLFVPEELDRLSSFVSLQDRLTGERYTLNDSGIIITEKLSSLLSLAPGDSITLCRSETERCSVPIIAVAENYLYHYVYMAPACYERLFGEPAEFTQLFLHTDPMNESESLAFSERLLSMDSVKSVSLVSDLQAKVSEMMDAMNLVIWVLIVAAGMLAFIVLFNLNNIAILERRRELATLRVLGFYDGELAAYLYRENIILTFLGIAAGVGLGILLHRFVIGTCEIDMIMFGRAIKPMSYLLSVIMTLFFAGIVNLGMFFTLRKIDMVESLKSVE